VISRKKYLKKSISSIWSDWKTGIRTN
jgi:hypothetical protein